GRWFKSSPRKYLRQMNDAGVKFGVAVVTEANALGHLGPYPLRREASRVSMADAELLCGWIKMVKAKAARFFLSTEDTTAHLGFLDQALDDELEFGVVLSDGFPLGFAELGVGVVAAAHVLGNLGAPDGGILVRHWEPPCGSR